MRRIRFLFLLAAVSSAALPQARAILIAGDPTDGSSFTFNFDENGNGQISVQGGPFTNLTGTLMPDPTQGGLPVMTYPKPHRTSFGHLYTMKMKNSRSCQADDMVCQLHT